MPSDSAGVPTAVVPLAELPTPSEAAALPTATLADETRPMAEAEPSSTMVQVQLIAITNVQIEETADGFSLRLEADGELATPATSVTGNAAIADIPNAMLQLSDREEFLASNPVEGISLIDVMTLSDNVVRIAITGADAPPVINISVETMRLTVSGTPGAPTAQVPNEEAIQVIVTGEQDDDYFVPNASAATRTDTPIRDIPQSIQVVPQRVLEDRVITNTLDTVRTVSGITTGVQSSAPGSSIGSIRIRGFESPTRLRNGLREIIGRTTDSDLTNLERIEIIKGPTSMLYGNGGIGGTVNLVTKQPLANPFYEISFLAGSYDLYRPSIDLSGPLNDERTVLYRLNAFYQDSGRFIDFGRDDRWFVAPVLSWQISPKTNLTLEALVSRQEVTGLAGLPAVGTVLPNPNGDIPIDRYTGEPDDLATYRDLRIGYDLEHRFSETWSLRNTFRYTDTETVGASAAIASSLAPDNRTLNRFFVEADDGTNNAVNDGFIATTDVVGNFSTGSIEHQLLFGVEYTQQEEEVNVLFRSIAPIDIFNPDYGASPGDVLFGIQTSFWYYN